MANKKIFCIVPWTNFHIYHDGQLGTCCSEKYKLYPSEDNSTYNIKNMNTTQWADSDPMLDFRLRIQQDQPLRECSKCYQEEQIGHLNRRAKENFKVGIFTEQSFDRSFEQNTLKELTDKSLNKEKLGIGSIDWHIDLGNECNLACKMCWPVESSKIAAQYKQWGILDKNRESIFIDWTQDKQSWNNFLTSIKNTPTLNRLHFMGGEPTLNKRFEPLLKWLIDNGINKTLSVSFVTNGTIFRESLLEKLSQFNSCDVEVSIESVQENNNYIRQGSDYKQVLDNILKIKNFAPNKINVILRSVQQLLNINNYYKYIRWAWEHRIPIVSNTLKEPAYLRVDVIPFEIRKQFLGHYEKLKRELEVAMGNSIVAMDVQRDVNRLEINLHRECSTAINHLLQPNITNEEIRKELISWLIKWDKVYKLDATKMYKEYADFFKNYGYSI